MYNKNGNLIIVNYNGVIQENSNEILKNSILYQLKVSKDSKGVLVSLKGAIYEGNSDAIVLMIKLLDTLNKKLGISISIIDYNMELYQILKKITRRSKVKLFKNLNSANLFLDPKAFKQGMRVLVYDKNEENSKKLSQELAKYGYDIVRAKDSNDWQDISISNEQIIELLDMKIKSVILPGVVAVVLLASVCYWIYEYRHFRVQPRVAGQDNRPEATLAEVATEKPEGKRETFDGSVPDIAGIWPNFRGVDFTGVVQSETPLAKQWPAAGPGKLWQVQVGDGYAGPAVYDGRVYLMDYDLQGQRDAIRCFSLADGKEIWRYSYPVKIKRNHGMSRTIPAVNGQYVVVMSPKCYVTCLDAVTGEFKWMIDLVGEYGVKVPLWYAGQCPLIVENKAILAPAGPEVLIMAVDCATGEVVWKTPNPEKWEMTHCSILPMRFAGQQLYVYPGSRGVAGVSAKDGTLLWQTDAWYLRTNVPTPVDCGDGKIFLSAGYNKGSMMLQLQQKDGKIVPDVLFELPPDVFGADSDRWDEVGATRVDYYDFNSQATDQDPDADTGVTDAIIQAEDRSHWLARLFGPVRRLYEWVLGWAETRYAGPAMAALAFSIHSRRRLRTSSRCSGTTRDTA